MVYEICVAIITLAFVILVIYIIKTLIAVQKSLNKITTHIDPIAQETLHILQNATEMTGSISDKLDAFDPLFDGINDLSVSLKEKIKPEEKKKQWKEIVVNAIALARAGITLWQKIKQGD